MTLVVVMSRGITKKRLTFLHVLVTSFKSFIFTRISFIFSESKLISKFSIDDSTMINERSMYVV